MLRTRLFVSHEISSAIDDFFCGLLRVRLFVWHKIPSIIYDFFVVYWLLGSLEEINPQSSIEKVFLVLSNDLNDPNDSNDMCQSQWLKAQECVDYNSYCSRGYNHQYRIDLAVGAYEAGGKE